MSARMKMEVGFSCAFTGHRKVGKGLDTELLEEAVVGFAEEGICDFYCGMAMGFDLIAAETVLRVKERFPQIRLIACVPCPDQERYFPEEEKQKYRRILPLCDRVERVSDHYFNGCMLARDRFMVERCGRVLAYLEKDSADGGTVYTVRYALSLKRALYFI